MAKRLSCMIMVLVFIFMMSGTCLVSAEPIHKDGVVKFQAEQITNDKEIEERMSKEITDDKSFKGNCTLSEDTILGDDGKKYQLKVDSVKATSQKIKETTYENGTISEYSGNIMASVIITPMGGGDETVWDYDYVNGSTGYNAKIYVHVIYNSGTLNTYPLYQITSLSGKLEKLDSTISLTKIDINENCSGIKYTSISESGYVGPGTYNMTATANSPSNNTYYYNNSLSPYYWNLADGSTNHISGTTTGYFQRGTTTWSAQVKWSR